MTSQMVTHAHDGATLERWRRSLGMSREALGAAVGGIASATVKRVERGEVKPHPSTLAALVGALTARSRADHIEGSSAAAEATRLPSNPAEAGRDASTA
jgi:predicted transcriptional regulator